MSITEDAWSRTLPVYERITQMPFIRELADGSLRRSAFEFYLCQDALYLDTYAQVLSLLGGRSRDRHVCRMFNRHAAEAVEVENMLHDSFIEGFTTYRPPLPRAPACRAYCNFLLASVYHEPYAGALGAVLPCYWVYWEIGRHVLSLADDLHHHPYRRWIETYADESFGAVVNEIIDVCNAADRNFTSAERELFLELYEIGTQSEYDFWVMGYEER
jgi:thiaminase/transcriptional activator TenA